MATTDQTAGQPDLEIHIKSGVCKVIEGPARQVRYTTEEAVGLALLKINRNASRVALVWNDFLASRGVAMGMSSKNMLTAMVLPAQTRDIEWRRNSSKHLLKLTFPACLLLVNFEGPTLRKSSLWVIKPGMEGKLGINDPDGVLCAFPYGNVYSHGGICWGTTLTRDCHSPGEIEQAFFTSGFNGDLWYPQQFEGTGDTLPAHVAAHGSILAAPAASQCNKSVSSAVQEVART